MLFFLPPSPLLTSFTTSSPTVRTVSSCPSSTRLLSVTRCSLPPSYDHPNTPNQIPWKDRIALFAQFSPEQTLDTLLQALRENPRSGPAKDDGIDALYAFANVDIWALTHTFFGRKMDLGQFERFKRVVTACPYDVLLRHRRCRVLSAIRITDDRYISRRAFEAPGRPDTVFTFTLLRTDWGGQGQSQAWMVDSILYQPPVE